MSDITNVKMEDLLECNLRKLTGVFEDLKFGDLFVLKNNRYVLFKEEFFYPDSKKRALANADTILDLGHFYVTGTGRILTYDENGKCSTLTYKQSEWDIHHQVNISTLEKGLSDLLRSLHLIDPRALKGNDYIDDYEFKIVNKIINFFRDYEYEE